MARPTKASGTESPFTVIPNWRTTLLIPLISLYQNLDKQSESLDLSCTEANDFADNGSDNWRMLSSQNWNFIFISRR